MTEPGTLVPLLLLGGWSAVDGTAVGQLLLARPLFAATLAGWLVGAPEQGLMAGLLLEALHLGVLPVGAARYPEGGPPAVVAGAAYAAVGASTVALLVAVAFALFYERVCGASVHWLRLLNRRLAIPEGRERIGAATLQRRHLAAVLLDVLRGAALTGLGLLLLPPLLAAALPAALDPAALDPAAAGRLFVFAALAALSAACAGLFAGRARLFALGALLGLLGAVAA